MLDLKCRCAVFLESCRERFKTFRLSCGTPATEYFLQISLHFIFLVLTPLGLTESARESTDVEIQRVDNVAQQSETDALKAALDVIEKEKSYQD